MTKRKIKLLILYLLFSSSIIFSQKIYVGVTGGLHFADMEFKMSGVKSVDIVTVYGAGGVVGIPIFLNTYLQIEPKYLQKGGLIKLKENGLEEIKAKTGYLEIPTLIRLPVGEKFHLLVGPTLGYMLSSDLESEFGGKTFKANAEKIMNNFDLGLTIGGGLSIPVLIGDLFLDGRYTYGITDISDDGTANLKAGDRIFPFEIDKDAETFNRGFKIMLGFTIPLGF